MQDFFDPSVRELDPSHLLPLVVGAHIESEMTDRASAYRLREQILNWQADSGCPGRLLPVVCTDLWYLNNQPLRMRPTIAIGRPELNAATTYLASRVPTAFMVEQAFRIQLDPELVELNACIWGLDGPSTSSAVDCFIDRYLGEYLRSVHELPSTGGARR